MAGVMRGILRRFSTRFFLAFVLLTAVSTALGGGLLLRSAGRALERELGERLTALAAVTAGGLDAQALAVLREGDEATPVHRYLKARLERIREATGARRLYVFTPDGESLVDTDGLPIGTPYGQFKVLKEALPRIRAGQSYASPLYRSGGVQSKSGFSPLKHRDAVVAGVAIEASARYLEVLAAFRKAFALILAGAIVLGGVAAFGLALKLSLEFFRLI